MTHMSYGEYLTPFYAKLLRISLNRDTIRISENTLISIEAHCWALNGLRSISVLLHSLFMKVKENKCVFYTVYTVEHTRSTQALVERVCVSKPA